MFAMRKHKNKDKTFATNKHYQDFKQEILYINAFTAMLDIRIHLLLFLLLLLKLSLGIPI